jgi:hypothetical protein
MGSRVQIWTINIIPHSFNIHWSNHIKPLCLTIMLMVKFPCWLVNITIFRQTRNQELLRPSESLADAAAASLENSEAFLDQLTQGSLIKAIFNACDQGWNPPNLGKPSVRLG